MEARILGTESEYGLLYSPGGKAEASELHGEALLDRMKALSSLLVAGLRSKGLAHAGEFLGNGGRFYVDRGGHPEYATPECRTIRDLVAYEKAGDRIVQTLVQEARNLLPDQGRSGSLYVFKNNVDSFGTTYGSHENYLVLPQVMDRIHSIIPFLVTRQIFAGAGKVVTAGAGGGIGYQLTQRSDFIDKVFSDRTSQVRGIINLRKREIPRQGQARRLHVIFGDSNMCEHAIALKNGVTSIILTLLEEGRLHEAPALASPVQAMRAISGCMDARVDLEGGKKRLTALEIQRLYLKEAGDFFSKQPTSEVEETLNRWSQTLEGLEDLEVSESTGKLLDDPADLKRKLDWVLKLWVLNRTAEQKGADLDSGTARLLDLRYHDLDEQTGLFQRCERLDLVDRVVEPELVRSAMTEPPCDTRAWLRGTIIREATGRNVEVSIENWDRIRVLAAPATGMKSCHPFRRIQRVANRLDINLEDPFITDKTSIMAEAQGFMESWD